MLCWEIIFFISTDGCLFFSQHYGSSSKEHELKILKLKIYIYYIVCICRLQFQHFQIHRIFTGIMKNIIIIKIKKKELAQWHSITFITALMKNCWQIRNMVKSVGSRKGGRGGCRSFLQTFGARLEIFGEF